MKLLLAAGADVRLVDQDGESALFKASRGNSAACVRLLIGAGGDPNLGSRTGETPLSMAASPLIGNNPETAYELIAGGAPLDNYKTASTHGPPTEWWYSLDKQDKRGMTILMFAASRGNVEVVKKLFAKKADVNKTNKEGKTALQLAQAAGHAEIVGLLQAAGAR